MAKPGVIAVVTGELLAQHKLAWMPTLSAATRRPCSPPTRFVSRARRSRRSSPRRSTRPRTRAHSIVVDYELLQAITSPDSRRTRPGASLIRDDKEGQTDNHIYHWESGDKDATEAAFAQGAQGGAASTRSIRAAIPRRSRRAAASPTSTR